MNVECFIEKSKHFPLIKLSDKTFHKDFFKQILEACASSSNTNDQMWKTLYQKLKGISPLNIAAMRNI